MARYKDYSYEQTKLIPLSFHHQILPGTFEYTLNYLIDNEVDLTLFEQQTQEGEIQRTLYTEGFYLRQQESYLHLPGGKKALSQTAPCGDSRLSGCMLHGCQARLRTVRTEKSVFKRSKPKDHAASVFLWQSIGASPRNLYGQDEAEN